MYRTMSGFSEKEGSSSVNWTLMSLVAASCVVAGYAFGSIYTSAHYAPAATRVATTSIAPIVTSNRASAESSRSAIVRPAVKQPASSETAASSGPFGAAIGGLAIAAVASLAAVVAQAFQKKTSNPLGISDYQAAEENWAMMAATAFVGTKAPDFEATAVFDQEFVPVKLSQYKGKKYVVLFFYPLDFTFVCPTEITAFSDRAAEFEAIDTQILGVSVDSQFSHLAWIQTPRNQGGLGEINYPLVADLKKEIAEAYGVLTEEGIALRGLFIIDKEGVIQHATINNLAFGRNVDETLRVLEAVQHVQANPDEVCPAGWKKGDKTMKPDPEGSKEYFQAI